MWFGRDVCPVGKFVESHGGKLGDISIYGQESNATTRRLAIMNLAIRGIEADFGLEHADTFRRDLHPDLRADYVLANPPFNDSDWFRKEEDVRWKFGIPPKGNANFAWVQHFVHHLAPHGMAGFVLANGSMSSNQSGEGEIRKSLIEADLVDCMVAMPGQLFYSTQIPVCLWFISRDKSGGKPSPRPSPMWRGSQTMEPRSTFGAGSQATERPFAFNTGRIASESPSTFGRGVGGEGKQVRDRRGETLFIDARKMGTLIDRVHRELTEDDIAKITNTYHSWRSGHPLPVGEGRDEGIAEYGDIAGFCKSATTEEIAAHGYVLTPGRYVGAEEVEDDGEPFEEKMSRLVGELNTQFAESAKLEVQIKANLKGLGYE